MLEVVGHKVVDLQRIRFGGLELGDLPEGEFRLLTARRGRPIAWKVSQGPRHRPLSNPPSSWRLFPAWGGSSLDAATIPFPQRINPPILLAMPSANVLGHYQYMLTGRFQYFTTSTPGDTSGADSGTVTEATKPDLQFRAAFRHREPGRGGRAIRPGAFLLHQGPAGAGRHLLARPGLRRPQHPGQPGGRPVRPSRTRTCSRPYTAKATPPWPRRFPSDSRVHLGFSYLNGADKSAVGLNAGLEQDLGAGAYLGYEVFERFSDFHQVLTLNWRYKDLRWVSLGLTEFQSWIRQDGEWGFFYSPTKVPVRRLQFARHHLRPAGAGLRAPPPEAHLARAGGHPRGAQRRDGEAPPGHAGGPACGPRPARPQAPKRSRPGPRSCRRRRSAGKGLPAAASRPTSWPMEVSDPGGSPPHHVQPGHHGTRSPPRPCARWPPIPPPALSASRPCSPWPSAATPPIPGPCESLCADKDARHPPGSPHGPDQGRSPGGPGRCPPAALRSGRNRGHGRRRSLSHPGQADSAGSADRVQTDLRRNRCNRRDAKTAAPKTVCPRRPLPRPLQRRLRPKAAAPRRGRRRPKPPQGIARTIDPSEAPVLRRSQAAGDPAPEDCYYCIPDPPSVPPAMRTSDFDFTFPEQPHRQRTPAPGRGPHAGRRSGPVPPGPDLRLPPGGQGSAGFPGSRRPPGPQRHQGAQGPPGGGDPHGPKGRSAAPGPASRRRRKRRRRRPRRHSGGTAGMRWEAMVKPAKRFRIGDRVRFLAGLAGHGGGNLRRRAPACCNSTWVRRISTASWR